MGAKSGLANSGSKYGLITEHCTLGHKRFFMGTTFLMAKPFVIAAGADLENAALFGERHAVKLRIRKGLMNEGVPHLRPVVLRYAANFFKSAHS